jgi:hypothetical protein
VNRLGAICLVLAACRSTEESGARDAACRSTLPLAAADSAETSVQAGPDFTPSTTARPLSPRGARELALDVAAHTAEIDKALPGHAPIRTESDSFLLVAAEPSTPIDAATQVVHDTVAALFHGPLTHRPSRAFTVWVFATPSLYGRFLHSRYPDADPNDLGYFDPGYGEIFVCTGPAGVTTAAHEVVHALLGDFPRAPYWLQEGLASLYELPDFNPPGEIHGKAHFRLPTLRTQLASPATAAGVRLDAVFKLEPTAFRGKNAYLAYALSREAMRWLDAQHKLWSFFRTWREGTLEDETGEKSFATVMGKSPVEASAAWVAWLQSPEAEHP